MASPAPPPQPVPLHVREAGSGLPLLLLHGLGGDHTVWNLAIEPLASEFRVLAPDLRGHGRSAMPEGARLTFQEHLADLRNLLDERGLRSAYVGGVSAGAFLALHWAIGEPDRVLGAILSGGATHCDAHTREVGRNWREVYRTEGFDAFFDRLVKDLYAAEWIEAHMDDLDGMREELRHRDFRGSFLWSRAVETFDLRGRFGRLRTPILVLHGMDDRVVDSSHARLIRQSITGTQVRLFPLTGHMVPVERPAEAVDAVRSWLRERMAGTGAPAPTA